MLAPAKVGGWRRAPWAPRGSRSRRWGSAAWGCPSSTGGPTRARRSRRSTARSSSGSPSSTRPTCTARARTSSSSARRSRAGASEVVLATKFGNVRGPNGEYLGIDGSPEYVRSACEASLERLGVETIDLYYQHRVDLADADRGDRRRDGRARAGGQGALPRPLRGGAGRRSGARMPSIRSRRCRPSTRSGRAIPRPRSCRRCASSGSASSPTARSGRGFLSGRIRSADDLDERDFRRRGPRFQEENLQPEPRARRRGRGAGGREGRHAVAGRPRLGARARRGHRPDPGDEAALVPRGERGGGRDRADARRTSSGSSARSRSASPRRPLSGHVDRQPVSRSGNGLRASAGST